MFSLPLTVDVELFEEGDEFFRRHSLLGHSILNSCVAVYQQNPSFHRLHQLMPQPEPLPTVRDRISIFLDDRKGLNDFAESMKDRKGRYDPRRVCAHVIRNLAWAVSGTIYTSYEKASDLLTKLPEAAAIHHNLCQCETFMRQERLDNSYEREYRETVTLIESTIDLCKSIIDKNGSNL